MNAAKKYWIKDCHLEKKLIFRVSYLRYEPFDQLQAKIKVFLLSGVYQSSLPDLCFYIQD